MIAMSEQLKAQICEIGSRLWQRGLVAGSDGNISVRLTDEEILCTPTMHSKGFMAPADICLVNMAGEQLAGSKQRSSEVLLHIEIFKGRPDVMSVVHCHAPHATAFAVAGRAIPMGVMPEADVFLGEVPIAPYETPGTAKFAATILPFVHQTNVCLLANHGVVAFGAELEFTYHLVEILDAYCRILLNAEQLGSVKTLTEAQRTVLAELREQLGFAPQ